MNSALKGFTDYLKYEGIQVDDVDAIKILDLYMRLTIVLTSGKEVNTGLNVVFTGKNNLDFSSIDQAGIQSIIDYTINFTDMIADTKLSADTTNSIISGSNIVTVLKAAHLFINTIIGLEKESLMKTDLPDIKTNLRQYTFVSHNDDGTCLSISGYVIHDNGTDYIAYDFVSNAFVNGIPDDIIYV